MSPEASTFGFVGFSELVASVLVEDGELLHNGDGELGGLLRAQVLECQLVERLVSVLSGSFSRLAVGSEQFVDSVQVGQFQVVLWCLVQ